MQIAARLCHVLHLAVPESVAGASPSKGSIDTRPVTDAAESVVGRTASTGKLILTLPGVDARHRRRAA
jgi:hypothetical protein